MPPLGGAVPAVPIAVMLYKLDKLSIVPPLTAVTIAAEEVLGA